MFQDLTLNAPAKLQKWNSRIMEILLLQLFLRNSLNAKEKLELDSAP